MTDHTGLGDMETGVFVIRISADEILGEGYEGASGIYRRIMI